MQGDEKQSFRVLTLIAATTTQTSDVGANPKRRDMYLHLNVTAGTGLSLKGALICVLADGTELPLAEGSTVAEVGKLSSFITPNDITPSAGMLSIAAKVPLVFKIAIIHGNTNPATYTVDAVWA